MMEAGLFPGVNYYLSWCVTLMAPTHFATLLLDCLVLSPSLSRQQEPGMSMFDLLGISLADTVSKVGTNVPSSAYVPLSSSLPLRFRVRLEDCSLYVFPFQSS